MGYIRCLSDKIGEDMFLFFGQTILLPAQGDALHEEAHVSGQHPHGLQTLRVLGSLAGSSAVDAVPVLAGGDGMPEMVKNLFSWSKVADRPPRRAATTLAPTFMVLSKGVE